MSTTMIDQTKTAITDYVTTCRVQGVEPGIPPAVFLRSRRHTYAEAVGLLAWLEVTYPAIYEQVLARFAHC